MQRRGGASPPRGLARGAIRFMGESREFRISSQNLEIGMFVSRLDRPWLDTSFPLQGLMVRTTQDLDYLMRLCSHVYVDASRGRAPDLRYVEIKPEDTRQRLHVPDMDFPQLRHNRWTLASDFALMSMIGTMRAETIARRMGRTRWAILRRCQRLGLSASKDSVVTSGIAARLTGLSPQYLTRLARQGRIAARRLPGGRWWLFSRVAVVELGRTRGWAA